ncbi:MAG: sigma-70 family RNA polymerase sigma factor [Firmicutes bacterium]|nr:sigma-70 family RNA polymerase sigma factor [Bacillota bacterium]
MKNYREMGKNNSHESNEEILRQYKKTADLSLRDRLICLNLHLVNPIVKKFMGIKDLQEDLIQVGYVGLIKAVDSFDPDKGVKFSTYATHCVFGEVRHYIRDSVGSIKIPRWLSSINRRVGKYIENYLQKNQKLPDLEEISKDLNIDREGVIAVLKLRSTLREESLDNEEESSALKKIKSLYYESFKIPIEDKIALMQAVERLKDIEQKIIYLFFYKDLTQTQIAVNLGISQKKVSRMMQKSISKLKEVLTRELW